MTTIAQRTSKQTVMRPQTSLGVVGSVTGQIIRRTSSVFKATRDTFKSNEIVSHNQSTGVSYGLKKTDGTLQGELSAGTYKMQIAALLRAAFATTATITAGTIAAAVGTPPVATFTDTGDGFLTAGFKIGMVVQASGFTGVSTNSNSRYFWITALTAGVMTGVFIDGTTQVNDAATESVTIAEVGKRCLPPLTGHTLQYLQVEEWYGDLTDSDLFNDVVVASIDFDLPATGNATLSSNYVGLSRVLSGTQVMGSPTAETTSSIMTASNGRLYVQGVSTPITGIKISAMNSAAVTTAEIGSNSAGDVARGVIDVSGTFSAMLRDQTLSALYDAETVVSIASLISADETATPDFMAFTLGRVKITSDTPDDNAAISRTYAFTAELNSAGGAALAWDKTILTVQDSKA